MDSIYLSLTVDFASSYLSSDFSEKVFSATFKSITRFLMSHPDFKLNFSFNDEQLSFIQKKHPEYKTLLHKWTSEKQVEVLGGSLCNSILPLCQSFDRNGQIDAHSQQVRDVCGKRPRGMTLFCDAWDFSLVTNLCTAGIEYVLMTEKAVPAEKNRFLPAYMNELGKSVNIILYNDRLIPDAEVSCDLYLKKLEKEVKKISDKDNFTQFSPNRIINLRLNSDKMCELLDSGWLENFYNSLNNNTVSTRIPVSLTLISSYLKGNVNKVPVFIPSYFNSISDDKVYSSAFDYVISNKRALDLYNRILYTSLLITQFHGDKARKLSAREKLWQAQNGYALAGKDAASAKLRHNAFIALCEAEKQIRNPKNFRESVIAFDYNNDGMNEYVCRMNDYFAVINLISGSVRELSVSKCTGNYLHNVIESPYPENNYFRGLFTDHIFTPSRFENYKNKIADTDGIFSKIQYTEIKFSPSHRELLMSAEAVCFNTKQKVSLRKKYIINSSGFVVQYILKNLSDEPLDAVFAVESNFGCQALGTKEELSYNVNVAGETERFAVNPDESSNRQWMVNAVQVTDRMNDVSFVFELNELGSYTCYNLEDGECKTLVSSQYWPIKLDSGMETEKTINFTIINPHKTRRKLH